MKTEKTTHFGYQQVPVSEKVNKVKEVFSSVAERYDVMNDLMSLGLHRIWKRIAVSLAGVRAGQRVLDVAGGTGDLAKQYAERVGKNGSVVLLDINEAMLLQGRDRLLNQGISGNITYVQGNAECLPFQDNYFDCVSIGFGLRNVTDKDAAIASMFRVLKPGGRLLILEFSKPASLLKPVYDAYSFSVLPFLGKLIAKDPDSYRYLAESIRMHPDQETLKQMMEAAGFARCEYFNMSAGIVSIHRGYKA